MSKRLIKLLPLAAAVSLGALALGGPANATTATDLPSVVVKYGDLDLNTPAGARNLLSRLRYASQNVCSQLNSRVLGLRDHFDQCVSDALKDSVTKVGNENLSKVYRYGALARFVASS